MWHSFNSKERNVLSIDMFYNTVATDLKPIDYVHRLVKLYCDKESNRVQYLLCCLNALIMVATVNLLRFGRAL